MTKFEVLISEEVAYKYHIKADNKEQAMEQAMDNHEKDIHCDQVAESIDRCEVINCEEIK